jgi:hypothetical protein
MSSLLSVLSAHPTLAWLAYGLLTLVITALLPRGTAADALLAARYPRLHGLLEVVRGTGWTADVIVRGLWKALGGKVPTLPLLVLMVAGLGAGASSAGCASLTPYSAALDASNAAAVAINAASDRIVAQVEADAVQREAKCAPLSDAACKAAAVAAAEAAETSATAKIREAAAAQSLVASALAAYKACQGVSNQVCAAAALAQAQASLPALQAALAGLGGL